MLVQEFQWSRSLTTVFLSLVPRNFRRLSWSLRLRFLYALFFYSLLVDQHPRRPGPGSLRRRDRQAVDQRQLRDLPAALVVDLDLAGR